MSTYKTRRSKSVKFTGPWAKSAQRDEKRYGREVAIFNLGFLGGWDDGRKKGFEAGFKRALLMGNGQKWTNAERRLGNRIARKFFGKKR